MISDYKFSDADMDGAYTRINLERARAAELHGYTGEYDDRMNPGGQLALAALCFYSHARGLPAYQGILPRSWPWAAERWQTKTPGHDLVKAGALALAELERCERMEHPTASIHRLLDMIARALILFDRGKLEDM